MKLFWSGALAIFTGPLIGKSGKTGLLAFSLCSSTLRSAIKSARHRTQKIEIASALEANRKFKMR